MMTTSVTPIERIASATGVPCATRTSTWRSLEMISSGVCLFWRIVILLGSKAILQDGPLQRGRITGAHAGSNYFAIRSNSLKLKASQMATRICVDHLEICGAAGYLENSEFSVSRQVRDI